MRRPLNRSAHGRSFVAAEVVHHDDVARREFGHEHLLDVSLEGVAVDRSIEHERCGNPGQA